MNDNDFSKAAFQRYLNERKLMGVRCQTCGTVHLPPRPMCANCHGQDMVWQELSSEGRIAAFTVIHIAPTAMIEAGYGRDNPYCSAVVTLNDGPSISAQILELDVNDPEKIKIGTPVKAAFLERGEGEGKTTFLAFEPSH